MRLPLLIQKEGETATVHLDLERIQQMAFRSIVRGTYFTELGLASNCPFEDFSRKHHVEGFDENKIRPSFVPAPQESELPNIKENFDVWIINSGLREMLETFHAYIDEVLWFVILKDETDRRKILPKDFDELARNFAVQRKRLSFKEKLSKLSSDHSIELSADYRDSLLSLQRIRHCLSHNLGIVSAEYFPQKDKKGNARITWQTMNAYLEGKESGKMKKLKMGEAVKEESNLVLRFENHVKVLPYGSYLHFTLQEFKDIAGSLYRSVLGMAGSIQKKYLEQF
jgi:hypothetical protein